MTRVRAFLKRLAEQSATDIVVFSHGQVMNTVRWLHEKRPQQMDGQAMLDWRQYGLANYVPNCQGFSISKDYYGKPWEPVG